MSKFGAKKFGIYFPHMDTFSKKVLFTLFFLGLTPLHSVNIQPNSKLHPPHQNFLDPPLAPITGCAQGTIVVIGPLYRQEFYSAFFFAVSQLFS